MYGNKHLLPVSYKFNQDNSTNMHNNRYVDENTTTLLTTGEEYFLWRNKLGTLVRLIYFKYCEDCVMVLFGYTC